MSYLITSCHIILPSPSDSDLALILRSVSRDSWVWGWLGRALVNAISSAIDLPVHPGILFFDPFLFMRWWDLNVLREKESVLYLFVLGVFRCMVTSVLWQCLQVKVYNILIQNHRGPGEYSPVKVVQVCPVVKTPFSCLSLDPSCSMIQFFRSPLWARIIDFDSCIGSLSKISRIFSSVAKTWPKFQFITP